MNVIPAGREPCACSSPINQILERLDQMDADIQAAQQAANTAVGTANSQAGVAAASAASAAQDASDALGHAAAAQQSADDALLEATNAAGSAQDAADDLADALLAIQNIEATIASVLASDIGAKVDKLTTAGFHLYTHNGSTQGEVAPDINPTAATIPIRDSDGKLFGADPANGATNKTLTTANWISQTGDSAPNNLMHRTANETVSGIKTHLNPIIEYQKYRIKNANDNKEVVPASQVQTQPLDVVGNDDQQIMFIQILTSANGDRQLRINLYGTDGTRGMVDLITVKADGTIVLPW